MDCVYQKKPPSANDQGRNNEQCSQVRFSLPKNKGQNGKFHISQSINRTMSANPSLEPESLNYYSKFQYLTDQTLKYGSISHFCKNWLIFQDFYTYQCLRRVILVNPSLEAESLNSYSKFQYLTDQTLKYCRISHFAKTGYEII